MKKRFVIINALMSVVILFAILFQSLHSYEHLVKEITEKKCLHKQVSSKEITHQHATFDKCFVCEFAFSSFITSNIQSFSFYNDSNFLKKILIFFKNPIITFQEFLIRSAVHPLFEFTIIF